MNDKLEKAVDGILKKTENGKIDWERSSIDLFQENPFYKKYITDHDMVIDGVNNYVAPYKNGYIYFTNQVADGYSEIAIQPNEKADITILSSGNSSQLETLEETIKNNLDNPDDFLNDLIN